jgi:hyperosmotically inducible protein
MRILRMSAAVFVAGMFVAPLSRAETAHHGKTLAPKSKADKRVERANDDSATRAADNTAANKRDRDGKGVTADQQNNRPGDLELAADIRRGLMDDKGLSTNAHNVKVIVDKGNVTLKGPVASEAEKKTVENLATQAADKHKGKVTSELSIAR